MDPSYVPPSTDTPGSGEVFFPTSDDEFDQVLAEFEQQEAALEAKRTFDALAT